MQSKHHPPDQLRKLVEIFVSRQPFQLCIALEGIRPCFPERMAAWVRAPLFDRTARRYSHNRDFRSHSLSRLRTVARKSAYRFLAFLTSVRSAWLSICMRPIMMALPLTSFPVASNSWTDQCQPYIKNRQVFRCPSDQSQTWNRPRPLLPVSWINPSSHPTFLLTSSMHGWQARACMVMRLRSPAQRMSSTSQRVLEGITRDHFHPFNWIKETPANPCTAASCTEPRTMTPQP